MREKYLNKQLYCIVSDKLYNVTKGNIYNIIDVIEKNGNTYLKLKENNVSFKVGSKYFLSPNKSLKKIRKEKYNRLNKNT